MVTPRVKMTKLNKNNKPDKNLLIIAQELKLARTLAGNNKTQRDQSLRKLKKWFNAREIRMPFTKDDFMTVWKGLFYYMWMSDKPLVQEECADNISKLADFQKVETSLLFFKCFLKTMINEWFGIDHLRLDKFLMLVRRVLRRTFQVLAKAEWNSENVGEFQQILTETVFNLGPSIPLSLSMHITEIYLEELAKVSKGEASEDTVLELTRPFAFQLAFSKDSRQSKHVKQHIFIYLMKQSDPGIEYQLRFDAWRQVGFPGGTIDVMEKVKVSKEENDEDFLDIDDDNKPMDPRAGKVHVDLPQLKFDSIKFAEMLEELKFKPNTSTKTRRTLTGLKENFRTLARGTYPFGLKKVEVRPKNKGPSIKVKNSLRRLHYFENTLLSDSKQAKSKKLRDKKIKEIIEEELVKYEKGEESETIEDFIAKSEEGILPLKSKKNNKNLSVPDTKLNIKKAKKRKIPSEKYSVEPKKRFQRNSGIWEVDDLENAPVSSPKSNINGWVSEEPKDSTPKKSDKKTRKHNKKAKDSDKQYTETEIKIKMNGNDIFFTPRSSLRKKSKSTPQSIVKNPFSTPVSSTKKVKIALDLNKSQDHKEYQKSLISSPQIPYDAEKMPAKPLLKARSLISSAINPFYKYKKH